MRELILLRHAKASREGPSMSDLERPLARRGRRAAAQIAGWLAATGVRPDTVLCSAAVRARETFSFLHQSLGDPEVHFERTLYLVSAVRLLQRLQELPGKARSVMLIGHNPGIQKLALQLMGSRSAETRARIKTKFPTAALVRFEVNTAGWGDLGPETTRLLDCVYPRDLDS